jgi:2-C-methyl-D-erythritol 4-phosphate cytidylyltransferase
MFSAIILAGGNSARMNGINKQLAVLEGIPVIVRSALAFERSALVDEIILAAPRGEEQDYGALLRSHLVTKLKAVTAGGATRFLSVKNALPKCSCEFIAVHDGARPLISTEDIDRVLTDAANYGAAAPVTDTIKICAGNLVDSTPDRDTLYAAQTPQAFRRELYLSCVDRLGTRAESLTDDSALLEACGEEVHITAVTACNMKVTRPQDLAIAAAVLRR